MGPCLYHQSHPQLGIVFTLAPSLFLSGVISPLISSSILGPYQPGEFLFQYPTILPFHTVHGVLSLLFNWGQTMVEVMKIMVTSFKRSHACTATPPTQASAGESWILTGKSGSVSCGIIAPFSWILVHKVLFVPSKSLFRVNGGFLQEGFCHTHVPRLLHPEPLSLWQSTADPYCHRRHSNTVLSQSLWGPWVLVSTRFV